MSPVAPSLFGSLFEEGMVYLGFEGTLPNEGMEDFGAPNI
jgi:hypothetical protein